MRYAVHLKVALMLALLATASLGSPARAADPAVEAALAKNARIKAANALIADLNDALRASDWLRAEADSQKLIALGPLGGDRWPTYATLGGIEMKLAKYQAAVDAYDTGIGLAQAAIKPDAPAEKLNATIASMLTSQGNAYLKLQKNAEAVAAFRKAAGLANDGGVSYFNLCATLYNMGSMNDAIVACDDALRADPTRADAYFIKGSALFGNGKIVAGVYTVPPGTVAALQKYLELAPAGAHAADTKEMLKSIGVNPK
jgi:tetratricopeptide (TPR) repeat protein